MKLVNEWFYITSTAAELSQLQVRVPKRVVKFAVNRNMIKRLVREAFRLVDKRTNQAVIVSCKVELEKLDRAEARAELNKIFEKVFA